MNELSALSSLKPSSMKDLLNSNRSDDGDVSFKQVFDSKRQFSGQETATGPGGFESTSFKGVSRRWMSLEVNGDYNTLKKVVNGDANPGEFSGDFSVDFKYKEEFHMLAKKVRSRSLSDAYGQLNQANEEQNEQQSLRQLLKPEQSPFKEKSPFKQQLTNFRDQLMNIGKSDDNQSLADLSFLAEGAVNKGLAMAREDANQRLDSDGGLLSLIDQSFEQTRNELDSYLDDVFSSDGSDNSDSRSNTDQDAQQDSPLNEENIYNTLAL